MRLEAHPDLSSLTSSSWAGRLIGAASLTHARAVAFLILLSLVCFLPGLNSLQPMDRDEPRFAQASKQMLETGDFVDIRFQDEARHKKPVGIYWFQAATVAIGDAVGIDNARTQIWLYRLPSLVAAIGVVLATYWAALAFLGQGGALLAAALMAGSILLGVEARLAKTDAMLAFASTLMFGALARVYLARFSAEQPLLHGRAVFAAFWGGAALGILVKGPIILMVAGLAILVLGIKERSLRWLSGLRPLAGLGLVLLIVSPWFIAILYKSGGDFLAESVGKDMLAKVGGAQERHGAPPGFYVLAFFGTFWPAAALAAIASPFIWATRREPGIALCLAWIIPSWLIFEAVPTKLPHYVLPLYPAIAILTIHALVVGGLRRRGSWITALLIPFIPVALLIGLVTANWILDRAIPYIAIPIMLLAILAAFAAWNAYRRLDHVRTVVLAVAASAIVSIGVFGVGQQSLRSLKLSPRLAEAAHSVGCDAPALATVGYREPSLVFLTDTELQMPPDGAAGARFLTEGSGCRIVFVTSPEEGAFKAALAQARVEPALVTRITGFNINGGRRLDIGVYAIRP